MIGYRNFILQYTFP